MHENQPNSSYNIDSCQISTESHIPTVSYCWLKIIVTVVSPPPCNWLRPQGGSEGQKLSKSILKALVEMKKMLKSASKNIIPSSSYDFLKITICL